MITTLLFPSHWGSHHTTPKGKCSQCLDWLPLCIVLKIDVQFMFVVYLSFVFDIRGTSIQFTTVIIFRESPLRKLEVVIPKDLHPLGWACLQHELETAKPRSSSLSKHTREKLTRSISAVEWLRPESDNKMSPLKGSQDEDIPDSKDVFIAG